MSLTIHTILTRACTHLVHHIPMHAHSRIYFIYHIQSLHSCRNETNNAAKLSVTGTPSIYPRVPRIVLKDFALVLEKPGSKLRSLLFPFRHFIHRFRNIKINGGIRKHTLKGKQLNELCMVQMGTLWLRQGRTINTGTRLYCDWGKGVEQIWV